MAALSSCHECLNPEGIGSMLRTKINVNLGVSRDCKDYNIEMQKVMSAVNMGAEAIMDLSSHGNTQPFRQKLTHECPVSWARLWASSCSGRRYSAFCRTPAPSTCRRAGAF